MPQKLETTAAEEMVIMDNLPTFEANGFKLKVDENAPSGQKIEILALPFSKSVQF